MSKLLLVTIVLSGLVVLSGCGNNADSLAKKQVAEINKLADAMESGAKQAELEAIQKQMKETNEAIAALDLSDAEKEALQKKYRDEIATAQAKLVKAMSGKMEGMMNNMNVQPPGMPSMPSMPSMPGMPGMPK